MKSPTRPLSLIGKGLFVFVLCASLLYMYENSAPNAFPKGTTFAVDENESLKSISTRLENEHYIHSALLFRMWVSFLGRDRKIQLGVYSFPQATTLTGVVAKLISGAPDAPLLSVTIPEGSTTHEIGLLFKKALPSFSVELFEAKVTASRAEGTLFPSTYYLLPSSNEDAIIGLMTSTFEKKYETAFKDAKLPNPLKSRNDVISLAAILEGEAKTETDMQIVAGILLKRLTQGLRLQVDVARGTYSTKGLPPVPIANPGLTALHAVFYPTSTPYLYYLTGKDGIMHYSKTFEEHKKNIKQYL